MALQSRFVQEGAAIDYTPASAVSAGDVVVIGNSIGLARNDIAANQKGSVAVSGIFDIVKDSSAFSLGDPVFWDPDGNPVGGQAGTGAASISSNGNVLAGWAVAAASATDTHVRVAVTQDASLKTAHIPVEDLAIAADIADRPIFVRNSPVRLVSAGILTYGAPQGVDDANTVTITLKDDAGNVIVSKVYNTATQPPNADYDDLGALDATHSLLNAQEHVELTVTQGGTTSNMPAFLVVLHYQ